MSAARDTPSMRYRTIVVDPPWPIKDFPTFFVNEECRHIPTPYSTMTVEEIAALPVADLAVADLHSADPKKNARDGSILYLWTTTEYLEAAYHVARSWRFVPKTVLVWCKEHRPGGLGGTFKANVEFVLVARRGNPPPASGSSPTRWFQWPSREHSVKPEAFFDMIEQVSPGPYLELFARRQRLGWDTWGNEALGHVELSA